MFIEARIVFGRGRLDWYDFVFIALAGIIVYPDEILDWVGSKTGKHFTWKHIVLLEAIALVTLALITWGLLPNYPRLQWWKPLLAVAIVAVFRGIMGFISRSFGDFP